MVENSRDSILERQRLKILLELFNKHKKIVDISIIVAISIVVFIKAFGNYDVTKYIDGGYYVLEVKTLINSGKLYYEAPPLFFVIASMFSMITNLELGLRIASAFIVSLQVPSFFISLYLVKGRKEAYFTLPFTIWNTTFYTMYGNLSKNLLGLAFIPIMLAVVWRIWKKNGKLILYFLILFMGTFCLTISHLPSTLIGVISVGILILLLALKTMLKTYMKIPKYLRTVKNQLKNKDFRALLAYPIARISIAIVVISFSLLLGVVVDNVFPHMPTWYSSSDMPSENYGNADEGLILLLSRFFLILLREPVIIPVFLGILFLLRPKSWEITIAIFLAIFSIDFSIGSYSWVPRLVFDLEIGRIFLYAICLGGITDFLAKSLTYFSQKIMSKIRKIKIPHIFSSKSFYVAVLSIISLTTFSIVNATSFSITNDRFFISEQFLEEYSTLGDFVATYGGSDSLVYAAHGEEFWFTVETGIEAKSTTSWNDFVGLMHEMTAYKNRSVFLLYPRNKPPVIGSVPLISIEKFPIGGQWGYMLSPQNLTFLGDYNYSFSMSFNFPASGIKNATLTIWQLSGVEERKLIYTEVLQVVEDGATKSRIFNDPNTLRDMCYEFSWLLTSIEVDFINPSIKPFEILLALYGGVAPFEIVNQSSFYSLFRLNNRFSLMEKYSEPYPNFAPQSPPPAPPNQPPQTSDVSHPKTLFFDFLSPIILWPFLISDNFYVKLLVAFPLTIFQLYFFTFVILLSKRIRKRKIN